MIDRVFTRLRRMKFTFQNMLAWCMILALIGADACVLQDLFSSLNWHIIDAVVCAIAVAVIVDGLPTFLGLTISRGAVNRKSKLKLLLLALAAVFSVLMSLLVCAMRYLWFYEQVDLGTISAGTIWEVYSQYFLMILPFLTSTAAFVIAALMHHVPAERPPEEPENEAEEEMNND